MRSLLSAIALAAASLAAPSAQALTFLTEENPPFNYRESGKLTGLSTEVVTELARRAGLSPAFEVLPWEEAYRRAQAKKDTCLYSTARVEIRERVFRWVGPVAVNKWAFFARGDFSKPVRSLEDARSLKVGAVERDAKVELLSANAVTNILTVDDDVKNPPRLLLKREDPDHIDLWATGYYSGKGIAARARVPGVKAVYVFSEQPLYLACGTQTPAAVTDRLSAALEAMKKDGTLARITAGYETRFGQ
jgi:polar amino acid transport system substrate-binding protein